jgi:hypothetical protein
VPVLTTLLVLAVVTVGIVRIAGSTPELRPAVASSMDRHAPALPIRLPMPTVERFDPLLSFQPPRACPSAGDGQNACVTHHQVSEGLLAAVRARYPRMVTRSAVTQMLRPSAPEVRPGLWSVAYSGSAGKFRLRIVIDRAEPTDKDETGSRAGTSPGGRGFEYLRLVKGRYTIQLAARAGRGQRPESFELASLANDPRLLQQPAATMVR